MRPKKLFLVSPGKRYHSSDSGFPANEFGILELMNVPEMFKFTSLISVPLFGIIALLLIKQAGGNYSLRTHTISQSGKLLTKPEHNLVFRLNFIIKGFLDLFFYLYILEYFKISLYSPVSLMLILSAVLFGSLGYFIEEKILLYIY